MMPLATRPTPARQQFVCNLMRQACGGRRPRRRASAIMIGDKQECLDTVERYRKVGVTHFIFMVFQPYPRRGGPGVRRRDHPGGPLEEKGILAGT